MDELAGDAAEHRLAGHAALPRSSRSAPPPWRTRALALATGLDEVGGDLGQERIVGRDGIEQGAVDALQPVSQGLGRSRGAGGDPHPGKATATAPRRHNPEA